MYAEGVPLVRLSCAESIEVLLTAPPSLHRIPFIEVSRRARYLAPPRLPALSPARAVMASDLARFDALFHPATAPAGSEPSLLAVIGDWIQRPPLSALSIAQRFPAFADCHTLEEMVPVAVAVMASHSLPRLMKLKSKASRRGTGERRREKE